MDSGSGTTPAPRSSRGAWPRWSVLAWRWAPMRAPSRVSRGSVTLPSPAPEGSAGTGRWGSSSDRGKSSPISSPGRAPWRKGSAVPRRRRPSPSATRWRCPSSGRCARCSSRARIPGPLHQVRDGAGRAPRIRSTMTADRIRRLLAQVQAGRLNAEEASRRLKTLPYENLGFAAVDHHRVFRQGMAEAIFCEGKTAAQAVAIARRLLRNRHPVLATRVEPTLARALLRLDRRARYEPLGRTVVLAPPKGWGTRALRGAGHVVIMTAGTAEDRKSTRLNSS